MRNRCPVCGYDGLIEPAWQGNLSSFEICPCCGTQFGYHDSIHDDPERLAERHMELRQAWIAGGMRWHGVKPPPPDWSPEKQLVEIDSPPS